jgi:hypothetical protein
MAFQSGKAPQGGAPANPTKKTGRPASETYKNPEPFRSIPQLNPKTDLGGAPLKSTRYGQNQFGGASSGGVAESGGDRGRGLSDLDISPPGGDEALETLSGRGVGPQDNVLNTQTRTLANTPGKERVVPTHPGATGAAKGGTVPTKLGQNEAPLPSVDAYGQRKGG